MKHEKQLVNDTNNNEKSKTVKVPEEKVVKEIVLESPQIKKVEKSPTHQVVQQPPVKEEDEELEVVLREKVKKLTSKIC